MLAEQIANRITEGLYGLKTDWQSPAGTTTRHLVVDNLLPIEIALGIYAAFPMNTDWQQRDTFRERKKTFAKLNQVDPLIAAATDAFHSDKVLQAVKEATGLEGIEADPSLYAGGISMMTRGDFLNPHIDNSHDAPRKRYRRLNLLYYISPDWQLNDGGNFELWDHNVRTPKVIASAFNRLVIMETTRYSWHSVQPVTADKARCCISNYYFSQRSPEASDYYHVTSFTGRPEERVKRVFGKLDNFARKLVAIVTGKTRGKSLARFT